jgi:hypothetical protein
MPKDQKDPEVEIARCKHCGELTVIIGSMGQCPCGCPGWFDTIKKVKVPRQGMQIALRRK